MKIFIKYMVSLRCKMVVRAALEELGLHCKYVELGEAETIEDLNTEQIEQLGIVLFKSGLKLMDDNKAILIAKIKKIVIEMVHYADEAPNISFSAYLTEKLNHPYSDLAALFSEVTGTTIEHYVIVNKIERVKELLLYDELNLTEIADKLNYSSVAHLSNQFKKTTGLTPTYFKQLKQMRQNIVPNNI